MKEGTTAVVRLQSAARRVLAKKAADERFWEHAYRLQAHDAAARVQAPVRRRAAAAKANELRQAKDNARRTTAATVLQRAARDRARTKRAKLRLSRVHVRKVMLNNAISAPVVCTTPAQWSNRPERKHPAEDVPLQLPRSREKVQLAPTTASHVAEVLMDEAKRTAQRWKRQGPRRKTPVPSAGSPLGTRSGKAIHRPPVRTSRANSPSGARPKKTAMALRSAKAAPVPWDQPAPTGADSSVAVHFVCIALKDASGSPAVATGMSTRSITC